MIHFYLGRSGQVWPCATGLAAQARQAGTPVLMLVPQQYTLSTERMLIRRFGTGGFFDLDVVSPSRLRQRVFARAGGSDRVRIDSLGKAMTVARVLEKEKDRLSYYASAAGRQGLCDRVGQMIADFKRARVTPEALDLYVSALPEGARRDKLSDLCRLYAAYEESLSGRFVDGEDVLEEMVQRIPLSDEMKNARLIICGFDVLTEEMGRIALAQAQNSPVDIILCDDRADEAFGPVTESVARLMETIPGQADVTAIREAVSFPADIAFLEQNLLSREHGVYEPIPASIRLYAAPSPYAEAHHAAEEILSLWSQGVPFSSMSVLCGSEEHYFSVLDEVLTQCRIPHHVNRKLTAANLGPAAFLISALEAVAGKYYPEDMIRLIKTGYLPITPEEGFRMENYILACGIRGGMFQKPFTRGGEQAAEMEDVRERMMQPLEQLRQGLHDAQCADDSLNAIFALLTGTGAYKRMQEQVQALTEAGKPEEASQLTQVWQVLMNLLDQMHELAGGAGMDGEEAAGLLSAGLQTAELSALPQTAESVICGVIGNAALTRPDYLFVMGLNDGILSRDSTDLMTEEEKAEAEKTLKVHLSLDENGRKLLARLDVYKALTNAGKRLYLSHAQALQDGTALRPLDMLGTIRRIFPGLVEEGGVTAPQGPAHPMALTPALEGLGGKLRTGVIDEEWADAWRYISQKEPAMADTLLSAFRRRSVQAPLPPDVTHQLFLDRVTSVNRVETFAVCPFRHFFIYGLKPQQRAVWKMQASDTGLFYHRAMEGFTRLLPTLPDWPQVTRREVEQLMESAAREAIDPMMRELMTDSALRRFDYQRYRRLLFRAAWTFTQAAQHSAFRQYKGDAELRFGYNDGGLPPVRLTLSDGSQVLVRGVIDRVERCQGDEGLYFRVTDFKMPDMKLEPAKIFWGTQLQLLIYMNAVMNSLEDGIPAGAYYYHLADPYLADPAERTDIERKLAQALCLKGITLRDAAVIRLMDDGDPPLSMQSLLKSDGDFAKNKQLATLEEMRGLMEHARKAAAAMSEEILRGTICASPLVMEGQESPCARCAMRACCRDRAADSRVMERQGEAMTFDELIEKVSLGEMPDFFSAGIMKERRAETGLSGDDEEQPEGTA